MQTTPSLPELQAWFLTVMTTPGGANAGLDRAHQCFGVTDGELLRPARGPQSRLHIYADGYVLRLVECLRADFPVLRKVMGDELFDFFAKAYIWRHPSRSPSLYALGAGFADFLRQSQDGDPQRAQDDPRRLPVDLARLERACAEAGRAPGLEGRVAPAADAFDLLLGQDMQVRLAPCTRLLVLSFPLQTFWEESSRLTDGQAAPALPGPLPSFLAVARLNYRIALHALQPWQFHFLHAAQAGAPVQHCTLHAAQQAGLPVERVLADAIVWLPLAGAAGMLEAMP